ncbi:acyl carrier protein [Thiohalocapsa sp. ML1]|jgi:acyl carrier protein|uniref:acyl carrier protein n=1 Tax=Thiohalocapsa sp. ML1 TaxID=1431688 RepID=UPI0007323F58|nr:phosphopantetheine-binding protein [Thiohalocapsa sp. ML1]
MTNDLAARLRTWILDNLFDGNPPAGFDDDTDLIADGVMDSLAIMRTIGHLETDHGISIDPGDIVPEHFVSVRSLAGFIAGKAG